jgi:hypothetical protein
METDRRKEQRRHADGYREALVEKVLEELDEIKKAQTETRMTLYQTGVDIRTIADRMAAFERAFPDGPDVHRITHEEMRTAAKAETEFWNELKRDIMKRGLTTALIIILGLAVVGMGIKLKLLGADIWTSIWQ